MNILKKATVALTVAGCLLLSTPLSTHAAEAGTCRHVNATLVENHKFQGTQTITFMRYLDVDGDGEAEIKVPDECRHAVFDVYVKYCCNACNASVSDWKYEHTYYTSHTEADCPKYGVIED